MFGERPPRTQQIGKPLQSAGVQSVTFSVGRFTIRGTFCEVAASQSCLAGLIKCDGVANHTLSGELNLQSAEDFDQLNVAVKRCEIDWLHIVPVRGVSWSEVATVPKRKSHRGLDLDLSLNSEVNIRKGWKENGGTK